MIILILKVMPSISILLAPLRSAKYRRIPITINMAAIRAGDLKIVSAFSSNRYPAAAPGTLAAARYQNNLPLALRTSIKPLCNELPPVSPEIKNHRDERADMERDIKSKSRIRPPEKPRNQN
jgi:hypothetical protein